MKKSEGRADLTKKAERRQKVKELMTKGYAPTAIAKKIGSSYPTVLGDVKYLQAYYTKLALNNNHIAEKIANKVLSADNEIGMIKKKLWDIFEEVEEKAKLNAKSKDKDKPTYYNTRMDILKSLLSRIETEQRLMKLFNPTDLIGNNYVSAEVFKHVLTIFKTIIIEMIPKDKQVYAINRMKAIDVKTINGGDIIDAELIEE